MRGQGHERVGDQRHQDAHPPREFAPDVGLDRAELEAGDRNLRGPFRHGQLPGELEGEHVVCLLILQDGTDRGEVARQVHVVEMDCPAGGAAADDDDPRGMARLCTGPQRCEQPRGQNEPAEIVDREIRFHTLGRQHTAAAQNAGAVHEIVQ